MKEVGLALPICFLLTALFSLAVDNSTSVQERVISLLGGGAIMAYPLFLTAPILLVPFTRLVRHRTTSRWIVGVVGALALLPTALVWAAQFSGALSQLMFTNQSSMAWATWMSGIRGTPPWVYGIYGATGALVGVIVGRKRTNAGRDISHASTSLAAPHQAGDDELHF